MSSFIAIPNSISFNLRLRLLNLIRLGFEVPKLYCPALKFERGAVSPFRPRAIPPSHGLP